MSALVLQARIFLYTSQLAYGWSQLGPNPELGRSGACSPEIFLKFRLMPLLHFVYFVGHKVNHWWPDSDGRSMDTKTNSKRLDRETRHQKTRLGLEGYLRNKKGFFCTQNMRKQPDHSIVEIFKLGACMQDSKGHLIRPGSMLPNVVCEDVLSE